MSGLTLQSVRGYLEYGEKTPDQDALLYDLRQKFYEARIADGEDFTHTLNTYFSAPKFPDVAEIKSINIAPKIVVLARLNHLNVKFLALTAYFMMHENATRRGFEQQTLNLKDKFISDYTHVYPVLKDAWAAVNTSFTLHALKNAAPQNIPDIIADAANLDTQTGIVYGAYIKAMDTPFYT